MYDDGYHNIVNIDFSKTVIENMTEKCKDRIGMECKINRLPYHSGIWGASATMETAFADIFSVCESFYLFRL